MTLPATADATEPVTAADEQIGVNGAIAAALTRAVGSMQALYVVLVIVGAWMALATWGPLHSLDPYPFSFLLFLDNVVQLVLCLVILVGQRVLGMAADRRAEQTYENAEAIFARISRIQAHLDRHDQALSRGVSLLESSPHPWIERHKVQSPPRALDQQIGVNGRIAAWLTERMGSMWAVYLAAVTQIIWTSTAAFGVQHFDPYPFAFMSFLSTLVQLIFMIVIMVGQGVLERAGDRRAEQTYLNGEAILHECRRMEARLTAQDRLIESLSGFTTGEIVEDLARAIHEVEGQGGWEQLTDGGRESLLARARGLGEQLAAAGYVMVPAFDPAVTVTFADDEAELLARLEHERFAAVDGAAPWEELTDDARAQALAAARRLSTVLGRAGMQAVRDVRRLDGAGVDDFTADEWANFDRAMMAAGVLVALAVGTVDSEEMFELVKKLREASIGHPRRFIREVTAASTFETGLRPSTTYADYEAPALATIRSASATVAAKAPDELESFHAFLLEIAEAVAGANQEGGTFGLGAQRRTPEEARAIEAIRAAISD
ncbi:DUF1003 domain-containing protein [Kribbella sp.]|uniref:DUF1003 domain-containing protein n=1 Tax=Kribbella sp. TaxID=1871183 RepID=UPI002D2EB6DC|nr:DUF1003 domain-containing protein [Kribbella sp.]HZX08655.1 DUF1003 domain-containing protein [Kribbella sp.]